MLEDRPDATHVLLDRIHALVGLVVFKARVVLLQDGKVKNTLHGVPPSRRRLTFCMVCHLSPVKLYSIDSSLVFTA